MFRAFQELRYNWYFLHSEFRVKSEEKTFACWYSNYWPLGKMSLRGQEAETIVEMACSSHRVGAKTFSSSRESLQWSIHTFNWATSQGLKVALERCLSLWQPVDHVATCSNIEHARDRGKFNEVPPGLPCSSRCLAALMWHHVVTYIQNTNRYRWDDGFLYEDQTENTQCMRCEEDQSPLNNSPSVSQHLFLGDLRAGLCLELHSQILGILFWNRKVPWYKWVSTTMLSGSSAECGISSSLISDSWNPLWQLRYTNMNPTFVAKNPPMKIVAGFFLSLVRVMRQCWQAYPHEWGLSNDRVSRESEGHAHLQPGTPTLFCYMSERECGEQSLRASQIGSRAVLHHVLISSTKSARSLWERFLGYRRWATIKELQHQRIMICPSQNIFCSNLESI